MKRLSQIISAYVALCLALAGLVGVSPTLHLWIEHGGQGTPHLHNRGIANSEFPQSVNYHRHADGSSHDIDHRHPEGPGLGRGVSHLGFLPTHRPFAMPTVPLARMGRALLRVLCGELTHSSDSSSPLNQPGHHHHGLAQLLSHGLVELVMDIPPLSYPPVSFALQALPADAFLPDSKWEAQTASRGPPLECR